MRCAWLSLSSLCGLLTLGACSGSDAETPPTDDSTVASGGALSGGTTVGGTSGSDLQTGGSSTGGADGQGATSGTGATSSSGGTDSAGTGGEMNQPQITGDAHVFVGTTEGELLAFTMNEADGSLTPAGKIAASGLNFFTLGGPTGTLLVVGDKSIQAFSYDPETDAFSAGSTGTTSGRGTHVALHPSGTLALAAHYGQNGSSLLSFESGTFSAETWHESGEKAHQARFHEGHAYVPCLGSNHIAQYSVDQSSGTLTPLTPPSATTSGGPRHMDFHPSLPLVYVLAELSSEIHLFDRDPGTGALTARPGDSVFTHADEQYHWSSDIKVAPNGRYLYAINRNDGSSSDIVLFTIASDGTLTRGAATPISGEVRSFGMDPKGKFLQVGSKSGVLGSFAINEATGALTAGPQLTDVGTINNTEIHYLE